MTTIKMERNLIIAHADTLSMGECFTLADEEAGDEVYMRIHDDVYNIYNSGIYIHNDVYKQFVPLRNKVICTQLETGWVFAFDKDERVIPVRGVLRWEEKHGIES